MSLLAILKKDLRLILRDRGQVISLFLMPLAFIVPISLAVGERGYNLNDDRKQPLPLANLDLVEGQPAQHAQELVDSLAESFAIDVIDPGWLEALGLQGAPVCADSGPACYEAFVLASVEQQYREAGVIIPAGFTDAIEAATPVSVTLIYNPVGNAVQRKMYEGVIEGSVGALSIQNQVFSGFDQLTDLASLAPQDFQDRLQEDIDARQAAGVEAEETEAALSVVRVSPANYTLEARPDTLQQTVPGYTVLFVFFLIGTVAAGLAMEKDAGTLRRLLHTPVRRGTLLAGKLSAAFVVGVLQVALMFAVGRAAFGMGLGSSPLGLLLLTMALSATAVSLGLLVHTFGWSSFPSVPLIVAALLAGCMFPADWLPPFLRTISLALPHTYAMRGYQDLLVRGQGVAAVLAEVGILLLYAAAAFLIGLRRYDFEHG